MTKYNLLWVDDDIENPELRSDRLMLDSKGVNVINYDNPDDFLDYIENNQNNPESIDCIIVDLSMPTGDKLKEEKTKHGTSTGYFLLRRIKESRFKDIPTIVYTITDNSDVKQYCGQTSIPYWSKVEGTKSKEFANKVINMIEEKNKGKEANDV